MTLGYPVELIRSLQLPDGSEVTLRPMRPEDARAEAEFVRGLSEASRRFRFMGALRELSPALLARFTQVDYDREMALVAIHRENCGERQIGVVRYIVNPDNETAEFALVVADEWQRRGLGGRMLDALARVARDRGVVALIGNVLADNRAMLKLCAQKGFIVSAAPGDPLARQETLMLQI